MAIRLDYLPNNPDMKIYQDDEMFCINTDTQVLGEFLTVYKKDIVLEIGTNTGALLLYASKFNPTKLIGIDINEKAIELAKKNMELNGITNYELKVCDGNTYIDEEVDVIIFNPPYFSTKKEEQPSNKYLVLAKHEDNFPLESMIECISRNLKNNGTLFFLFQTSRLNEVFNLLNKKHIKVKEMKFVYDENKENSNVFMIKAVKNAKEGMIVTKPIIIKRGDKNVL